MTIICFNIATNLERNFVLVTVRDAIALHNGWIVDQQLYANLGATVNFEIPFTSLDDLHDGLLEHNIKLHRTSEQPIVSKGDLRGSIAITFSHNEPDIKRTVPAFG